MAGKAEYRSAIRSRRLIREAFIKLLEEKDFSRITVTDIVQLADINRTTFYAHYPDMRGLLEEIENEIIAQMKEILSGYSFGNSDPTPQLLLVSRYLQENEEFYRTLILANGADRFLEKLNEVFMEYMLENLQVPEDIRSSYVFRIRVSYFSGGFISLYRQWFRGQLDCSLDDIAREVGRLAASMVQLPVQY